MISTSETDLICDLAETYGVLNYKALPVHTLAALSVGLRDDSRIKMRLNGINASTEIQLMAAAVDRLSLLVWAKTKDGIKGRNRPKSIVESINNAGKDNSDVMKFNTIEDFEAARKSIIEEIGKEQHGD